MYQQHLERIERANLAGGVLATAVAGIVGGPRAMLAAGLGAAIGGLNFRAIRRLATGALERAAHEGTPGQAFALVLALVAKMGTLFVVVWAAQRFLDPPVLPFVAGLCVFVFSCVSVGLQAGNRPMETEASSS